MRSGFPAVKISALLLFVVCTPVGAQTPSPFPESALPGSATAETASRQDRTEQGQLRLEQTVLSPVQRVSARAWDVTEAEYRRYLGLMHGVRGAVSDPRISPLEVLGIHAEGEAERIDYARRFAQVMHDDTARVLAFERAYQQAWRDLYPEEPVIDPQRLRPEDRPHGSGAEGALGYQLLYFLDTGCADCAPLLGSLLRTVQKAAGARLDLYLTDLGPGDEAVARSWATDQDLDPALVRSGRVTLNLGRGVLEHLAPDAVPPQVYFRQDGRILPLDPLSALAGVRP
jgi:integrating conjugative element protein (TIGR03759 family)